MSDLRLQKLAKLLVEYSLRLKKGQKMVIRGHYLCAPLIRECYRAAIRAGAHVETLVGIDGLDEIFFKNASQEQLTYISPIAMQRTRTIDAFIGIWADANTRTLTGVDPAKMAAAAKAGRAISKVFADRAAKHELNWVGTLFPTNANAQDGDMSLAEYEEFVYQAGHLDAPDPIAVWKAVSKSQQAMVNALNKTREIRVVAPGTDLVLGVKGRKWINCDGRVNFPDGEVFTGPVEKSVNGHIRFTFPAVRQGREVVNPYLEFKDGKCVKATADKGQDFLQAMIDMDKGSCSWASWPSAPTTTSRATPATRSSTRRSAAPSTLPSERDTPRPATATPAVCTGTSLSTSGKAARSSPTENSCKRTAASSINASRNLQKNRVVVLSACGLAVVRIYLVFFNVSRYYSGRRVRSSRAPHFRCGKFWFHSFVAHLENVFCRTVEGKGSVEPKNVCNTIRPLVGPFPR